MQHPRRTRDSSTKNRLGRVRTNQSVASASAYSTESPNNPTQIGRHGSTGFDGPPPADAQTYPPERIVNPDGVADDPEIRRLPMVADPVVRIAAPLACCCFWGSKHPYSANIGQP
jgi:hypothetical protein